MKVIHATNVNDAYIQGMNLLALDVAASTPTRNGPAFVYPDPVTTVYARPCERVLFDARRDANPFFHLLESLWMLAGRNDVGWLSTFNKRMATFSDDGDTFNAAYGHRWRTHFGYDQLEATISLLRRDPTARRVIVAMWGAADLTNQGSKDLPCNLSIKFDTRGGVLNMYVLNRSNDIIWGAYGANAVHMSVLQEYVARSLGFPVGRYWQVSLDYHAYVEEFTKRYYEDLVNMEDEPGPYELEEVEAYPIMEDGLEGKARFDYDLAMLMGNTLSGFQTPFFRYTVAPMLMSYEAWREGEKSAALALLTGVEASDWRLACTEWLERRKTK